MDILFIIFVAGFFTVMTVIALWGVVIYNRLITYRNRVTNAWAQIDVQLKRRMDLVPNLIETVKGYATHEKNTLERVVAARTAGMNAGSPGEAMAADNMLTGALKSIFALAEAYPDLKANTNFLDLQNTLTETENKIAFARQHYNDSVMFFNNAIQVFPSNIVASMFKFVSQESFDAPEDTVAPPRVSF